MIFKCSYKGKLIYNLKKLFFLSFKKTVLSLVYVQYLNSDL